jgi:hypothetical protein
VILKELLKLICRDGKKLGNGILKVDGFINHQVETQQEYRRRRLKSSHAKSAKGAKKKLIKLYDLGVLCGKNAFT